MEVLRDINLVSIIVRLSMALVFGGILGIERARKRRPAGFRTYMIVCIAATLVMMTNQYINQVFNTSDPARMGAQVISGIGFLGAGTIIVTGRQQVRGLTTAAGLWAAACAGLAIGIGFYEGAICGGIAILAVMTIFHKVDNILVAHSRTIDIYVEFDNISGISKFLVFLKQNNMKVIEMSVTKGKDASEVHIGVMMTILAEKKLGHEEVIHLLSTVSGIAYIDEI